MSRLFKGLIVLKLDTDTLYVYNLLNKKYFNFFLSDIVCCVTKKIYNCLYVGPYYLLVISLWSAEKKGTSQYKFLVTEINHT
jgi:hypothetical protein